MLPLCEKSVSGDPHLKVFVSLGQLTLTTIGSVKGTRSWTGEPGLNVLRHHP